MSFVLGRRAVSNPRKIRVAFLLPHLATGGVERIILNLLVHLDRNRFEPIVILRDRCGDLLGHVPDDVPVYDLGGTRTLLSVPRLRRCLDKRSVSVVYAGTHSAGLAAVAAAGKMRRAPAVIVSEHAPLGHHWDSAKWPRIRRVAMRLLYPRAWGIVAPIIDIAQELQDLLDIGGEKIHVLTNPILANPILTNTDDATEDLLLPASIRGNTVLVAAGRLEHVKGFDILIDAMARLDGALKECHLIILGDGPERRPLEAMAVERGLGSRVHFPGRVPNPEDYYRKAFAVVVSSRFESGPNVLVEAMAVGTPVISSDCPFGPRRILLDGECGLLVPPEDPDAIAAAVQRLSEDPSLYARLREKGLRRAQDFTIETALPAYEKLFMAAVGSQDVT
jgi:glycosyltransferase involved in cell wall biosynthesis